MRELAQNGKKTIRKQWLLALCCFLTAGLILSALLIQYPAGEKADAGVRTGGAGMLRMFTNDGNLFTALASLICGVYAAVCSLGNRGMSSRAIDCLRLMAAVSEAVIFMIVVAVLIPMGMKFLLTGYSMIVLHAVAPLITVVSFLILNPRPEKTEKTDFLYGGIPVLLYGVIVLILCVAKVWTGNLIPYPFFNVYGNPVWLTVVAMVGIIGCTVLLSLLLDRIRGRRPER